jgi:hypothetical protein
MATSPRLQFIVAPACRKAALVLGLILLALSSIPGCHGKNELKPTKLMPPLMSGYSPQKVQRELNLKIGDWNVLEDRRPLVSDQRPEFRMLTVSRQGFAKFGVVGEVVMTFYNDRLMTTLFYPTDLEALRAGLAHEAGISFSAQGDARIEPSTRVWIGKARDGRSYVGWIDLELQRQQDEWIDKYER